MLQIWSIRVRGDDQQQGAMFSYMSPEQRVPRDHPLQAIRAITDPVLQEKWQPGSRSSSLMASLRFMTQMEYIPALLEWWRSD